MNEEGGGRDRMEGWKMNEEGRRDGKRKKEEQKKRMGRKRRV